MGRTSPNQIYHGIYFMVAEQVTNPDHQFEKEELAAEYETAPPENDVLGLL